MFSSLGLYLALLCTAPPTDDKQLVDAWLKVSLLHAQDYVIQPADAPNEKFTMLPQAVFRHSQPVRGDDIGAVYLWVDHNKRPAALGTTFAWTIEGDRRAVVHEFHSLADQPLSVQWRGHSRWKPKTPGLEWKLVPNAPAIDKSAGGRQRQMREISRRFAAESVDHKGKSWELRLLSKPIHQFEVDPPTDVLCGSLNIFCQGTDPELILAVEARQRDGVLIWHYAAASFTDYALKLRLDDKEVWTSPEYSASPTSAHWVDTVSQERLPTAGGSQP